MILGVVAFEYIKWELGDNMPDVPPQAQIILALSGGALALALTMLGFRVYDWWHLWLFKRRLDRMVTLTHKIEKARTPEERNKLVDKLIDEARAL